MIECTSVQLMSVYLTYLCKIGLVIERTNGAVEFNVTSHFSVFFSKLEYTFKIISTILGV